MPIHAAGIYNGPNQECCADYVVSSYTPTLADLLRAQKHSQSLHVPDFELRVVASAFAADRKLPPIPNVEKEVQKIRHIAEKKGISVRTYDPTISQTCHALKSADIVHVASHAVQNSEKPFQSCFYLSDGALTICKLVELDHERSFFAFLNACETAKGDGQHIDQSVHLAATLLFTGFKSIVATMW
jgi:CHAT domain-containing protein